MKINESKLKQIIREGIMSSLYGSSAPIRDEYKGWQISVWKEQQLNGAWDNELLPPDSDVMSADVDNNPNYSANDYIELIKKWIDEESKLGQIVSESVKKVLKESVDEQTFEEQLYEDFKETLTSIFNDSVQKFCEGEKYGPEYFEWSIEEFAEMYAKKWTDDAIKILKGNDWNVPQNNFRPLDFVMNQQDIHSFQDLLARENPVEIFTDWFWSSFGTNGIRYNFESFLSEELCQLEKEEEGEEENNQEEIIRESVGKAIKKVLKEDSYRKAAKKGDHTSKDNKQNLKFWKKNYGVNCSDFHKYAKKHKLDKMAPGSEAIFQWEDGVDKDNNYVGGGMRRKK